MATDKKGAQRLGAYIVFIDESGAMLTGTVCRTWAPCGRTPQVYSHYRHDKLSLISGLSVSPQRHHIGLYYWIHRKNIQSTEVCEFLRHLLKHLRKHLFIVWDNGKIHKGPIVQQFLSEHSRIHLEYLPGYAPELNPDEGVWSATKTELANGRPDTTDDLQRDLKGTLRKIGRSRAALRACFHQSDLPPFL